MKDKTLREVLFGSGAKMTKPVTRTQGIEFPVSKDGEKYRKYTYRKDDGFVLYLIEMIEKLEERIGVLEKKKK